MTTSQLDFLIKRLTNPPVVRSRHARISEDEIVKVAETVSYVFLHDPVCIDIVLDRPLYIVGDLYGQHGNLVRIFNLLGHPSTQRYLFLGNYVNRGDRSVELITLLLAYKLRYPDNIFMLRGNHECHYITYYYGFLHECQNIYGQRVWRSMMRTFNCLPAAAIVEDVIFCSHSGLIKDLACQNSMDKAKLKSFLAVQIDRPVPVTKCDILAQLIWSEPVESTQTWAPNPIGMGWNFGEQAVHEFCEKFEFQQIIRSNEMAEVGYHFMADGKLLTIFAIPCSGQSSRATGAIVKLQKNIKDNQIVGRVFLVSLTLYKVPGRQNTLTISVTDTLGESININETFNEADEPNPGAEPIDERSIDLLTDGEFSLGLDYVDLPRLSSIIHRRTTVHSKQGKDRASLTLRSRSWHSK